MRTAHILLLCILGTVMLSAVCTVSPGPEDCCFQFYPNRLNKNLIKSYYLTDHRCPKTAVVLVTKKLGRRICVDPSLSWAKIIMKFVDDNS